MMNTMDTLKFYIYFILLSIPTLSMALNMLSGHISSVEISKNVIILYNTLL